MIRAKTISIPVADQQKALDFYTKILGFKIDKDIPLNEKYRWITVTSQDDANDVELLIEPAIESYEPAKVFQAELKKSGMPWTQFYVDSLDEEFKRLSALNVDFTMKPTDVGSAIVAILDDTCGNLIQLIEMK